MTPEQIVCALNPEKYDRLEFMDQKSSGKTPRNNLYSKSLKSMREDYSLISRIERRTGDVYFLTKKGYEFMQEYLNIPPGKIGLGYNEDFGYFDYDLYRPPQKQLLHHLSRVDFFLVLKNIAAKESISVIKHRDNLYSSVKYEDDENNKSRKFMPDGEVMIGEKKFWIEIDTGTEFADALTQKFRGYSDYISYLHKNGQKIADGILFISNKTESALDKTRSLTIIRSFFSGIGEWDTSVNLIIGSLTDVKNIIMRELRPNHDYDYLSKILRHYFQSNRYDGSQLNRKILVSDDIKKYESMFSGTYTPNGRNVFVFERFEGIETIGLARAFEFNNVVKRTKNINKIIPVFYSFSNRIKSIESLFFDNDEKLKFLERGYCLDLKEDIPKWTNIKGEALSNSNNPFI